MCVYWVIKNWASYENLAMSNLQTFNFCHKIYSGIYAI